ncbi:hypothetical protein Val02_42520 [Virgisporangium aliadipatigenens]|uniref:Peptidase S8/S53 domain-containing protein n=1 Tax=Virgisporangium aliadipatigenens TaxID=741659 RepID=A0A8J4DRR7_9ACTN|nr:type VII secretion-associated serine protease mycosin [Virgisporangium aliadipatigenens]GIJ47366.1 hypothetical protein Val02_42520 [Virgisporangium aliadipatigenens]
MRWARATAMAAGLLVVGPVALISFSIPSNAAPACPAAGSAPPVASDPPWPQRRFDLERLNGLADGTGIVVAVVDSGVDATHPQLAPAVRTGLDLLDAGTGGRLDCVGHGTAVASLIAARPQSGAPLRGVAPAATILPVRVTERLDGTDTTNARTVTVAAIAGALRQAVELGARVINLSLTTEVDDPALREAVRFARARDVVLVAAAGNRQEAGSPRPYPAAYEGVIGVGGIQQDGSRVPQSQVGDYVDLVAPGADVVAAAPGGGYGRRTGTSFASAFVAGTAALIRQYHPTLNADQVAARLLATTDPPAAGTGYGSGVLNPYRAVTDQLRNEPPPKAAPLPPAGRDPAAAAVAHAESAARTRAYKLAALALSAALALLLAGAVIPRLR